MRISSLALVSSLMAGPGLAMAEPPAVRTQSPAQDAEAVADSARTAIATGASDALVALMGASVRYDLSGMSPCAGVGRKGTARGGKRAKLARCVVEQVRGLDLLTYRVVKWPFSKGRYQLQLPIGDHELELGLRPQRGALTVVALTFLAVPPSGLQGGRRDEPGLGGKETARRMVTSRELEQLRVSGDRNVLPDAATLRAMVVAGAPEVLAKMNVCVDRTGVVDSVAVLTPSGFPAFDEQLTTRVATWRYRPYLVDGTAAPICSVVQFVYRPAPTP